MQPNTSLSAHREPWFVWLFSNPNYVVNSKCFRNHFIFQKYKSVQSFQQHFLQNSPLCNNTLLPATVRLLESFLEAILWKPFQLFRRILNDASSITIAPSVQCLFQSRKQVQFSSSRVRRVWGCYSVVALLYANLTKTDQCAGALPWKRNQLQIFHFSERFLLTASLRQSP